MYKDIFNATAALCEKITKISAALASLGIFFGAGIIFLYLKAVGMTGEFIPSISSPQTLIALTAWSATLTITMFLMMALAPWFFTQILKPDVYGGHPIRKRRKIAVHTVAFLTPPYALLGIAFLDIPKSIVPPIFFAVIGVLSIALFRFYTTQYDFFRLKNLPLFGGIILATMTASASFIFMLLVISPTAIQLLGDTWIAVGAIIAYYLLYAFVASLTVEITHMALKAYIPVLALALATMIFCFAADLPKRIASKLNIGNYTASIVVDEKGYSAINANQGFQIKQIGTESYLVRNIFVHLNLSNVLIFSASSDDKNRTTISTSSIVAMLKTIEEEPTIPKAKK